MRKFCDLFYGWPPIKILFGVAQIFALKNFVILQKKYETLNIVFQNVSEHSFANIYFINCFMFGIIDLIDQTKRDNTK